MRRELYFAGVKGMVEWPASATALAFVKQSDRDAQVRDSPSVWCLTAGELGTLGSGASRDQTPPYSPTAIRSLIAPVRRPTPWCRKPHDIPPLRRVAALNCGRSGRTRPGAPSRISHSATCHGLASGPADACILRENAR